MSAGLLSGGSGRGWRVRAAGALAVVVAAALGAATVSALGAPSLAANHRTAQRDAVALLQRVVLRPGASAVATEPAGDGGALGRVAIIQGGVKFVDRHAWWTVPEPAATVYAFLRQHPPAQAKLFTWGGTVRPSGASARFVAFAFPPGVGYLPLRELVVGSIALPGGDSGVRVDAEVQWIIPRPTGERIPGDARVLDITVARPGAPPVVSVVVSEVLRVRRIAAMIDRLQTVQPEVIDCPEYPADAPVVAFTFRHTPNGTVLARAVEPAYAGEPTTPCDPMTIAINGRRWTPLLGGAAVLRATQEMLRVRLVRLA